MSAWTLKGVETCSFAFILAVVGICAYASDPYDYKPLVAHEVQPVETARNVVGNVVADFGRDAVGWLELDGSAAGPYEIVISFIHSSAGAFWHCISFSLCRGRFRAADGVAPDGRELPD